MGNNIPSYLLSPEAWLSVGATLFLTRLSSRGSFSIIDLFFVDLKVLRPTRQSFRRAFGKDNNNNHHQKSHSSHTKYQKNKNSMTPSSVASSNSSNKTISERRIQMLEFTYDCIQPNELANQSVSLDEDDFYSFLDSSLNYTAGCIVGVVLVWVFGLIRTLYYSCEPTHISPETSDVINHEPAYASLARVAAVYPTIFLMLCNAQITISFLGGTVSDVVREIQQKTLQTRLSQAAIGLAVYWLLQSGPFLQVLGISSTAFALEEFSARLLLFNCYMYNIAPRSTVYVIELIDRCTTLTRIVLAIVAGSVIGDFIAPIVEKARTAAIVFKGSCEVDGQDSQQTRLSILLVKTGIVINAILPCLIMDTYFNGRRSARVIFAWLWVLNDLLLTRPLLQSYLYQALMEAIPDLGLREITFERLQKHFLNQYRSIVIAASGFSSTALFVIMLLLFTHVCGFHGSFDGDSSTTEISFDLTSRQPPTPIYDTIQSYTSNIFGDDLICPPLQNTVISSNQENEVWKTDSTLSIAKTSIPTTLSTIFSFQHSNLSSIMTIANGSRDEQKRELQEQGIWSILPKQYSLTDGYTLSSNESRVETTLTTMFFHKFISPTIVYAIANFFGFLFCFLWIICYSFFGLLFLFNGDNGYRIRLASMPKSG